MATRDIDGIEYDNSTTAIGFIQTEEGKAVPNGTLYDYNYYLGDNLGNTKVTFGTKTGSAVQYQKDDYYSFGLEINRSTTSPKNEYLYNGKELQEELTTYDYGARFYDPVIARWTSVDPLATNHSDLTPYNYVMNNPIRYIDEFGLDTGKVKPAPKPIVLKEVKITATKAKKKSDVDPVGTNLFHHTYKPAPWNHDDCHCPVLDQVMILATIFVTDGFGEFLEGGAAAESDEIIQFGQNENQISHALRHLEEEGLSPEEITDVKSAIKNDLSKTGGEVKAGAPVTPRTITVNGVKIQYNAFRLNNSVINVGRITILK